MRLVLVLIVVVVVAVAFIVIIIVVVACRLWQWNNNSNIWHNNKKPEGARELPKKVTERTHFLVVVFHPKISSSSSGGSNPFFAIVSCEPPSFP